MRAPEACKRCQSKNKKTFTSEVAIHFPGLSGLKKPIVWVFPQLSVCLDCGCTELAIPERELKVLQTAQAVEGAVVSEGAKDNYAQN